MRRSLSLIWTSTSSASGQHGDGHRRRVDAAARLGGRHALHAVHAALVLQLAVDAAPLDHRDHFLQAADAGVAARHHLEAPAVALGVHAVHPEQLGGEERRLVAAGAGADLEHDVLLVVRILRDEQDLHLADQRRRGARSATSAPPGRDRACRRRRPSASSSVSAMSRTTVLYSRKRSIERLDLGQRLGVLPVLGRLALHLARAEQPHQLFVALFFRRELIEHNHVVNAELAESAEQRSSLRSQRCSAVDRLIPRTPAAETRFRRRRRPPDPSARSRR